MRLTSSERRPGSSGAHSTAAGMVSPLTPAPVSPVNPGPVYALLAGPRIGSLPLVFPPPSLPLVITPSASLPRPCADPPLSEADL